MEIVKLLLLLVSLIATLSLIFVVVALLLRKKATLTDEELLKEELLKCNNNCSACGLECEKVYEKILSGEKRIDDCIKLSKRQKDDLKNSLNITPIADSEKVAFIGCRGGDCAVQNYIYEGAKECIYLNDFYEGPKLCKAACLGCMDCANVCPTGAIKKNKNGVAEVDRSLCIGCGDCIKVCPDQIIKMIPISQEVAIACNVKSKYFGGDIASMCSVGCTDCGKCLKVCTAQALRQTSHGIEIDNSKCTNCYACVYACPNGTITRLNKDLMPETDNLKH